MDRMNNIELKAGIYSKECIYNNKADIYKKITAITNRNLCQVDFLAQIELLCKKGISSIILREKDMAEQEYETLAEKVMAIGKEYNTPVILHSFINVAERLGSSAIHLPMPLFKEYMENKKRNNGNYDFKIVGVSTHTVEEAIVAEKAGATYITASHIYATDCKKDLEPKGIDYLKNVCKAVSIPVYALGGIHFGNMSEPLEAGADKVCMMSELMKIQ